MKVSIIIPVFNNELTILQTINSVQAQSYSNWEIVCVDDGSTDKTESIVNDCARIDYRIKYKKRVGQIKGGSACRNIGIREATGDFIIFLDGDDILADYCLENRVSAIREKNYDFAVFPFGSFSTDQSHIRVHRVYDNKPEYLFVSSISAWIITSTIFKRSFLIGLGGFDESFPRFQDIELHLRALTSKDVKFFVFTKKQEDCYYRLSTGGYNIGKLQIAIGRAFPKLINLIQELIRSGKLSDKQQLTYSMIALYANMSIIKYSLWRNNVMVEGGNVLIDSGLLKQNTNSLCIPLLSFLSKDYSKVLFATIYYRIVWLIYRLTVHHLKY